MRVDVFFGAQQLSPNDVSGCVVAVIDVLRASTTIAVALANGAKMVVPCESPDEVMMRSKSFEPTSRRLAGERRMIAIEGFDLGNSPREFTREAVDGCTILLSTTNGTGALLALQGARDVTVASYVNFSVVLTMLRRAARSGTDVAIVCAGHERQMSLEDAACAGRYVRHLRRRLTGARLNDGAVACAMLDRRYGDDLAQLFADSSHGRALSETGFADDLTLCASIDAYPVLPAYQDHQITKIGSDKER